MSTRIKICGITRAEDALSAARLGVHAVGLMFYPYSKRCVGAQQAREIRRILPPFVSAVAVFLDATETEVRDVIATVDPDLLQFHGRETREFCGSFGLPYIKAIAMANGNAGEQAQLYPDAQAIMLDSHAAGEAGGSGRSFDWNTAPGEIGKPVILAGGLTPENVGVAIATLRPYAVDVSSGVESAPGIKDARRMEAFVKGVQRADS